MKLMISDDNWLLGLCRLFFGMGTTRAVSQSVGRLAEDNEERKITTRKGANASAYLRRKAFGMLSGPGDDLALRFSNIDTTPGCETISEVELHCMRLRFIPPSKFEKNTQNNY